MSLRAIVLGAFAALPFAIALPSAHAQAPSSLSDTVFTYGVVETEGHLSIEVALWLRPDGTYVSVWSDYVEEAQDMGLMPELDGTWTYTQTAANQGTLMLVSSEAAANPSQTFNGAGDGLLDLTFTSNGAGSVVAPQASLMLAEPKATFSLRPSAYGKGPVNLSCRTTLASGASMNAGFVITGTSSQYVLFRGIGTGLTAFILGPTITQPVLSVYSGNTLVGTASNWSATTPSTQAFDGLFALAGAFQLIPANGDAAMILLLPPGAYVVQLSGAGSGNAMLEAYFLP